MYYPESKVYSDGNHFIAIPHTTRPSKKRKAEIEEIENCVEIFEDDNVAETPENAVEGGETIQDETTPTIEEKEPITPTEKPKIYTRKDMFDVFYDDSRGMKKGERKNYLRDNLLPFFDKEEYCENFIKHHLERKHRNVVVRHIRLNRKVNLQDWNYFLTFTYDDELHTEETFKKKLKLCLWNLTKRKGWKYIGVWERGEDTDRLHFHGIFYIPEGAMVGKLFETNDYNVKTHKREKITQNTFFAKRFGRSKFEVIQSQRSLSRAVEYITKYIEKTGDRLVFSRGLPQYFISDIQEDDVICHIGLEEKKLLLFDNFTCIDNGKRIGKVSQAVIAQMRKSNN